MGFSTADPAPGHQQPAAHPAHTVLCPPPQINTDPYGEGWMVKVKLSNPEELKELMSAKEYEEFCG